jgi:hypothetical protein
MPVEQPTSGRVCDPKVCETRPAVLGNQDIVLDVPYVNVQAHSSLCFAYRSDGTV